MTGDLSSVPLAILLDDLASESPAPGGGTASALAGAMAAALVAMVARLSLAKEVAAPRDELKRLLIEAEERRRRLLALAGQDAQAYLGVLTAYRLPKQTPAEKTRRSEAVGVALSQAAQVPLEVAGIAVELVDAAEYLGREGYPAAATDAEVAVWLARAAARGALANVEVNLKSMRASPERESLRDQAQALTARCCADSGPPGRG